jgi:Transposase domain (DUF772)
MGKRKRGQDHEPPQPVPPGIYFRLLLIGYFEGVDSERGTAWRAADSMALRDCLGLRLTEARRTTRHWRWLRGVPDPSC